MNKDEISIPDLLASHEQQAGEIATLREALERMVAAYTGDWLNCAEAIAQARAALRDSQP